ncbi:hypothetical protein PSN45_000607 [Yamadazyma tenuis]|uniref:Uncharacterized protein n=1 Tax=Candida tenuis (strain ATCC 10573 / BCRC 21748 / CBS 615 / JCM 9827 / NBRC 10315 / NRRL Y-1498 / VKM Y-70) TaxID=590646 RepID=G3B9K3_CANTC|nr:uncharacterized protein CANTEDRAFT_115359 [Yamadazyma tenuis ATCC 10573]EGV61912.1 hypothetical protein CANTEDRAFT_115359 [Yamadazyma tenuis ATCC 10573]WEJ93146.1 hypothetical protein PSN45_000607 [Yamadazyma tenuis]
MAHPGRPRRRNKTPSQSIPHQQVPQHYLKPIKEEPTTNLHDESDLISFRTDAYTRFINNQELLENVVSKYIHSSKIIPPKSFPDPLPKSSDLNALKYDEVYFGDLAALKHINEKLEKELNSKEEDITLSKEYEFQSQSTARLARLTCDLKDESCIEALETEMKKILAEYKNTFHMKFESIQNYKPYKASIDVHVDSAPANYNPRSLDSMINMNQPQSPEQNNIEIPHNPGLGQNGNSHTNGQDGGNGDNDYFDNSFLEFQQPQSKDMLNDIVDDDMGGLINFQDDDIMNGNFDEDFLSQIDHSME